MRHDELKILLLAARSADEAVAVLQAAQRVAHEAKVKRVVLWECAWPFELKEGALTRRTESLPMICPLREGVDARGWGNTCRALWI